MRFEGNEESKRVGMEGGRLPSRAGREDKARNQGGVWGRGRNEN